MTVAQLGEQYYYIYHDVPGTWRGLLAAYQLLEESVSARDERVRLHCQSLSDTDIQYQSKPVSAIQ